MKSIATIKTNIHNMKLKINKNQMPRKSEISNSKIFFLLKVDYRSLGSSEPETSLCRGYALRIYCFLSASFSKISFADTQQ